VFVTYLLSIQSTQLLSCLVIDDGGNAHHVLVQHILSDVKAIASLQLLQPVDHFDVQCANLVELLLDGQIHFS
jgi:hypothetical protein